VFIGTWFFPAKPAYSISSFTGILYKVVILIMACNGHLSKASFYKVDRNNNNLSGRLYKKDMGFFIAYAM